MLRNMLAGIGIGLIANSAVQAQVHVTYEPATLDPGVETEIVISFTDTGGVGIDLDAVGFYFVTPCFFDLAQFDWLSGLDEPDNYFSGAFTPAPRTAYWGTVALGPVTSIPPGGTLEIARIRVLALAQLSGQVIPLTTMVEGQETPSVPLSGVYDFTVPGWLDITGRIADMVVTGSQSPGSGSTFDTDGDGICDLIDNCPDLPNPIQRDSDGDGIGDGCDDVLGDNFASDDDDSDDDGDGGDGDSNGEGDGDNSGDGDNNGDGDGSSSSSFGDFDGDGIVDTIDNCPTVTNAEQLNWDHDGMGDACDPCPLSAANDFDNDGICGELDNCLGVANASQLDFDQDGIGDACDPCPFEADNDTDNDEVCDGVDNCPEIPNADQLDSDEDGAGDACDPCPLDADDDIDDDGVCGDLDNCPEIANVVQRDWDDDGVGDACDDCPFDANDDGDEDGYCADEDNCPEISNADQTDMDSDNIGDACDDCPLDPANDIDGDGVCGGVDNCPTVPNANQSDANADGVGDACDLMGESGAVDFAPTASGAPPSPLGPDGGLESNQTSMDDADEVNAPPEEAAGANQQRQTGAMCGSLGIVGLMLWPFSAALFVQASKRVRVAQSHH